MVKLYYWNGKENAGDYFSYWLAKKLYKDVVFDELFPNLIIAGSILGKRTLNNDTIVWGAGWHNYIKNKTAICTITKKDNFKAVRGKLTRKFLGLSDKVVIGDPGILASKFYTPKECKDRKPYCIITHFQDYKEVKKLYGDKIDVYSMETNDVEGLFETINKYEFIFSTSLHGIIFAHSFGIPATFIELNNTGSKNNFKFKDYYSALDIPYIHYLLNKESDVDYFENCYNNKSHYLPSKECVESIQENLLKVKPEEKSLVKKSNNIICAIAKNENDYIGHWVNWNLNLGFDKIYLFDNNDASTPWVGSFIKPEDVDKVTIINVNGIHEEGFQLTCYNKLYDTFKDTFKWCAFIDIDEFFSGFDNINKFVNSTRFKNYDMIRIKWRTFTDGNHIYRPADVPVTTFFTEEFPKKDHWIYTNAKCIIRGGLENVFIGSCHYAYYKDKNNAVNFDNKTIARNSRDVNLLSECLPSGKPCQSKVFLKEDYSSETVFLNHYMTKTISEFIKQKLGRTDAVFKKASLDMSYFWRVNQKTKKKQEYIKKHVKAKFLKTSYVKYTQAKNSAANKKKVVKITPKKKQRTVVIKKKPTVSDSTLYSSLSGK